jgi:hypothetical protein
MIRTFASFGFYVPDSVNGIENSKRKRKRKCNFCMPIGVPKVPFRLPGEEDAVWVDV